jgi:hypothetical protein
MTQGQAAAIIFLLAAILFVLLVGNSVVKLLWLAFVILVIVVILWFFLRRRAVPNVDRFGGAGASVRTTDGVHPLRHHRRRRVGRIYRRQIRRMIYDSSNRRPIRGPGCAVVGGDVGRALRCQRRSSIRRDCGSRAVRKTT